MYGFHRLDSGFFRYRKAVNQVRLTATPMRHSSFWIQTSAKPPIGDLPGEHGQLATKDGQNRYRYASTRQDVVAREQTQIRQEIYIPDDPGMLAMVGRRLCSGRTG